MRRRWTFAIGWQHGESSDADEVTVVRCTEHEARAAAIAKWRKKTESKWPGISLCDVFLLRVAGVELFDPVLHFSA